MRDVDVVEADASPCTREEQEVPVERERWSVVAYAAIHDGAQVHGRLPGTVSAAPMGYPEVGVGRAAGAGTVRAEVETESVGREGRGLLVERRVDRLTSRFLAEAYRHRPLGVGERIGLERQWIRVGRRAARDQ